LADIYLARLKASLKEVLAM